MKSNQFYLVAIACLLSACSSVSTVKPITEVTGKAEQALFTGYWHLNDGIVQVNFDDEGKGRFGWLEWEDGAFTKVTGELHALSVGDDDGYLSVRFEEEGEMPDHYLLMKYTQKNRKLLLSMPATDLFQELVENKSLSGTIEKSAPIEKAEGGEAGHTISSVSVLVQSPPAELLKILDANDDLFDREELIRLKRVRGKKDGG